MSFSDQSVFVYGTLKPGGYYWPEYCEGKASAVVPAKIRGTLYDLHVGYPGLILNDASWVQGYVMTFPQRADFEQLDVLEGYVAGRPAAFNEYLRLKVECYSPEGERLGEVWTYEMTTATFQRRKATCIEDGNWPVKG